MSSTQGVITPSKAPTREMLRGRLREMVNVLQAGARLPSERDLAAEWGVARMTLRAAVDALVSEGLLERRHGAGTFVTFRPVLRMLGLTSFSQDMRFRGVVPSSRVLEFRTIESDAALSRRLQIPLGSPVFSFTRLRLGSGEPMAIETVRIPVAYAPGLTEDDLTGSLYDVLAARYRIVANTASVLIEPTLGDERSRALLTIDESQACLRLLMVDADSSGRVVMLATCLYRGDKYQLHAEVTGNHAAIDRALAGARA
jgi:GntR family transcriptional regulator